MYCEKSFLVEYLDRLAKSTGYNEYQLTWLERIFWRKCMEVKSQLSLQLEQEVIWHTTWLCVYEVLLYLW